MKTKRYLIIFIIIIIIILIVPPPWSWLGHQQTPIVDNQDVATDYLDDQLKEYVYDNFSFTYPSYYSHTKELDEEQVRGVYFSDLVDHSFKLFVGEFLSLGNGFVTKVSDQINHMEFDNSLTSNSIEWRIYTYQACGPEECLFPEFLYTTIINGIKYSFYLNDNSLDDISSIITSFKPTNF